MGQTRDYYADLELPPASDIQEVKKQFRKLGTLPRSDCRGSLLTYRQLSNTTPTGTQDAKSKSTPGFKSYSLPMRSSAIRSKKRNTMQHLVEAADTLVPLA